MTTILVTGAGGFIGSHTTDHLLALGHTVVGVDNWRTGRRENLQQAIRHPQFRLAEFDVTEPGRLAELVADAAPAAIIHLAALVSVQQSIADPALNFRLNIQACQIVAEVARQCRTPRVVFSSSAAVYGSLPDLPARESSPTHPLSPYGAAKLAGEVILLGHAAAYGFVVRCQRYFNVYGPRQDPASPYSGVISVLTDRFRRGEVATIFGDGEQTRDFISVCDVARANALAATTTPLCSGVANICTGVPRSLKQITACLRGCFPAAPNPQHAPARAGDIRHSHGSPERARRELNFAASIELSSGLAEIAAQ
ncbi:MAG: hypothetical protein RIQ93_1781 [Verrucomicrobiota bacterium]|jgi:UDP-glucose 4-epimerase